MTALRHTPLWPAGHLPLKGLKGGDRMSLRFSPISNVARGAARPKLPISPLEGETPNSVKQGRPEGGVQANSLRSGQRP
ncbi:MAG: lytic murein transglycosylase [Mesorhizobium sp.]|nr:MAG: lytic murein transglycosylase [Mesorhizobium sp.]TIL40708.1 MAG: lytic murein transglycosylase [Mesorhizobium sp.]TIM43652.1 MAG: lytic murein transglycosylase [Mesorhizobium sp.]